MTITQEPEIVLHGGASIHSQIRAQIHACILQGRLRPGEQLPSVREVAVALGVNPAVVDRAYASLERDGLVSSADGSGTFVAAPQPEVSRQAQLQAFCADF